MEAVGAEVHLIASTAASPLVENGGMCVSTQDDQSPTSHLTVLSLAPSDLSYLHLDPAVSRCERD
jgi:hypothetical protein